MSQTLFLSTVTAEFGPLRQRLAALLQRTKKVHVRHQDDFFHRGVKTLHMLEEEIAASSFVVHVIGKEPGWCPPVDQVKEFLGRHQEFARRFPNVAAAGKQSYGAEHPDVARDLNNLAWLLKAKSQGVSHDSESHATLLAEAEPLMRRALAIDEQSYGAEHPRVAIDLNNLAWLLKAKSQGVSHDSESHATLLAEAELLMRRAVAIFRMSLGDEHPNTLTGERNLDALLAEMK